MDQWVVDLSTHAYTRESHHSSFVSARSAVGNLRHHQRDMEQSAANKFSMSDAPQQETIKNLNKVNETNKNTLNKFNFELRIRMEKLDERN